MHGVKLEFYLAYQILPAIRPTDSSYSIPSNPKQKRTCKHKVFRCLNLHISLRLLNKTRYQSVCNSIDDECRHFKARRFVVYEKHFEPKANKPQTSSYIYT